MQGWLFGHEAPRLDATFSRLEHLDLGEGAWIELQRGWIDGHVTLFEQLENEVEWREEERHMYERVVAVPRLFAVLSRWPATVEAMRLALSERYGAEFSRISAALYRHGRDSVAWHGDYIARESDADALVATVSLGAPRKVLLRQKDRMAGGGRSRAWEIGCGDLFVMGGSCQRTHQHAVPKTVHAEPRIALMFRPVYKQDE
jgi:alkylated DNA repair dioxygenase AlkB